MGQHTSRIVQRLLIADDEPQILTLIKEALHAEGWLITLCRDGLAAFEALEKSSYSVAILDIMMPRRTGMEVLLELRNRKNDTPVVLMSSFIGDDVYEACRGLGRIAFLPKPFTLAELRGAIDRASSKIRC